MAESEFRDAVCSLLNLLVPVILIPEVPMGLSGNFWEWEDEQIDQNLRETASGNFWEWEDEQIDQNQRETARAIASHLTHHATAHERLKGIKPSNREYRKIKKVTLATSEAYRNTLIPHATEL